MSKPDFDDQSPDWGAGRSYPGTVRVCPVGKLDMATAPLLHERIDELREAGCRHLILDLRELDSMDSTGVRLILRLDAEAPQDGFSLSLVPGSPTATGSAATGTITMHGMVPPPFASVLSSSRDACGARGCG